MNGKSKIEQIARDAQTLRVAMTHVPKDREYVSVLRYRIAQEIKSAEKRIEALRALDERVAQIDEPVNGVERIDAPRVHVFETTGEAYDLSQCSDEIANGDVLVVPNENAVGVMLLAWPVALGPDTSGDAFHQPTPDLDWTRVEGATGVFDYSLSRQIAGPIAQMLRENVDVERDFAIRDDATGEIVWSGHAHSPYDALNAYMDEVQIARYPLDGLDRDTPTSALFYKRSESEIDATFSNTNLNVREISDSAVL